MKLNNIYIRAYLPKTGKFYYANTLPELLSKFSKTEQKELVDFSTIKDGEVLYSINLERLFND